MLRYGLLAVLVVGMTGISRGALVYDPVTNTYVTSGSVTSTGSSVTTGATTSTWTAATGTVTTSTFTNTGTRSTKNISFSVPSPDSYEGILAALHVQLDEHLVSVMNRLQDHMDNLDDTNTDTLKQAADRLRILTCLGVIQAPTNIYDLLGASALNLQNSIEIVGTDMHSNISALEEKMDKGLLDDLVQQLEVSSMQNKVDTFLIQYSNVVDLFFEVSIGKVEQVEKLFTNLSPEAKKQVEAYDASSKAYLSVMAAYDSFLKESSFAGEIAGPQLHELIDLTNGLRTYQRSVLLSKRQTDIAALTPSSAKTLLIENKKQLLQDFSLVFNEKTQTLLGSLYPIDELLVLNKQIMSLRGAYTDEKTGFSDCKAFVNNSIISITGPELEKYMAQLLTRLTIASSQVTSGGQLPQNREGLLYGLKNGIDKQVAALSTELLSKYKADLQAQLQAQGEQLLGFSTLTTTQKVELSIRSFLQKKYLAAIEAGTLTDFQTQLLQISKKIDNKLNTSWLTDVQRQLLGVIEWGVVEFLE